MQYDPGSGPPKPAQSARDYFVAANLDAALVCDSPNHVREEERQLRSKFSELCKDEAVYFAALAQQDKARYNVELAAFIANGGSPRPSAAKRPPRDPGIPKKPVNEFMYFSKERRRELSRDGKGDVSRRLGELWAALPPNDRAQFEELALKDRQRYTADLRERGLPVPASMHPTTPSRVYTLVKAPSRESSEESVDDLWGDDALFPEPPVVVSESISMGVEDCSRDQPEGHAIPIEGEGSRPVDSRAVVALQEQLNAEKAAMIAAMDALQERCRHLEEAADVERDAYFKIKVLLGAKRRRRIERNAPPDAPCS
jgi:hypothetical protein